MKVCAYCNTMNEDNASACSSCGGKEFKNKCANCGTLFDTGAYCPNCGVKAGSKAKKCLNCGNEYFSNACPNCGYTNETNQRAVNTTYVFENETPPPAKRGNTLLWILGWIFILPLPLTILVLRKQTRHKVLKIGFIILAWLIYLAIVFGEST